MTQGRLISSGHIQQELRTIAAAATERVLVVSAYIKVEPLKWLLAQMQGANLTVVCRWRPADLISKASDLGAFEVVEQYGGNFKIHADVHAKAYACDDKLIVGSHNLTGNGFGFNRRSNLELATIVNIDHHAESMLAEYQDGSTLVTRQLYQKMRDALEHMPSNHIHEDLTWPDSIEKLLKNSNIGLYSFMDFPCVDPADFVSSMGSEQDLRATCSALGCDEVPTEMSVALAQFRKSVAYNWVVSIMERGEEARFGALTDKLHDRFIRDPRPFRSDIKLTISCLLKWLELMPEFSVATPGRRSQVLTRVF